ncbi:hypothetical protein QMO56_04345 [Roseomonas sp. E05]|uniref:hypothetical protein n=1 Tax=Roseomonas sp. E05 TaxID=3046310 RepID=UPI0024B9E319|nr:hypothetical protein [Roseomonas sp. E05]MDJ0387337.1 hypothetical protein [Roseomonas sp. E05]
MNTNFPKHGAASAKLPEPSGDLGRYWSYVEHLDVSDARKAELLEAVWRIMRSFVDRAFGDDPAQLARIAGDRDECARDRRPLARVGFQHTQKAGDTGDLAGTFRRCGEGE